MKHFYRLINKVLSPYAKSTDSLTPYDFEIFVMYISNNKKNVKNMSDPKETLQITF
jgi:hypothetical protein